MGFSLKTIVDILGSYKATSHLPDKCPYMRGSPMIAYIFDWSQDKCLVSFWCPMSIGITLKHMLKI